MDLTVLGCAIAGLTLAALFYFVYVRRSSSPRGDVELQPGGMESRPTQAPAPTQRVPVVAPAKPKPVKLSYEQWKEHRDWRNEERKEWLQKKKAELDEIRLKQGRNAGLVAVPISPLRASNARR
jgi:hypothetical protein